MTSKVIPNRVGVFAFDPGKTTGVGWTLVKPRSTLKATLQRATIHTQEIKGDWKKQAEQLRDLWVAVSYEWTVEMGVSAADCYCIREDFELFKFKSSKREGVYPIWIGACFEGLMAGSDTKVFAQGVVDAKRLATNERLKRWGVYIPGSEHKRDVTRHIAFRLNRIL